METTIRLHPKQYEAYNFTTNYGLACSGIQGGKTFLGSIWSGKKISELPRGIGLIAAPTVKILRQSTLQRFFEIFPELVKFYKEQKGEIELPSGGIVYVRSTDNPLGIEGMTLDWAWLDEANMMHRLVWLFIRGRLAVKKGQCLMTSSWYNLGWLYKEVYLPCVNGLDSYISVFKWRSVDNPYFSKEFYEQEKQRLSKEEFARRYEGEPTRMEGLIYEFQYDPKFKMDDKMRDFLANPEQVIAGVDFGFTNPTGILIGKVKDGHLYITAEWKREKKTTPEIIDQCKLYDGRNHVRKWYPDPAEPDRIEEMKRAGLYCGDVNKDVEYGISVVKGLVKEKRFHVSDDCVELLDELEQYHYEDGEEVPVKENDHLCDALRYMVVGANLMKEDNFRKQYLNHPFRDKTIEIWNGE